MCNTYGHISKKLAQEDNKHAGGRASNDQTEVLQMGKEMERCVPIVLSNE